jgi:PAS domain S-box-containing protein
MQPQEGYHQPGDELGDELREVNEQLLLAGVREQAAAEQATDAVKQLTALLQTMTEGVTVFNGQGRVLLVNTVGRAMLRCFGAAATVEDYRRCELISLDRTPVDFQRDILGRLLRGEHFSDQELVLLRPDGTERHLLLSGNAVRGSTGQVALAINVYRDVTDIRLLEQVREQYVSLISHDLRGPLSAAKIAAQLMARDIKDPDRRRALAARLATNLNRMEGMLRDLLDAQRVRAGHRLPLTLAQVDLVAVARDAIEDLGTLHGDRFLLGGQPTLPGIWSGEELRRAIWNLASNAIKYGSSSDPVVITIDKVGDRASLSVHNGGAPIPAEELASLFAPFTRSRAAEAGGLKGWGLGLTLVRGCADAHGGTLSVRSDLSGTIFTIELPLDARQVVESS